MQWSYRIGKIAGTEIKVHITFVLLLVWIAFSEYKVGGWSGALDTTGFFLALFACILLHEFGHITAARRFGVRTPDVILLPIGGVARLERMPQEPRQELVIALAGPAVTLGIVVVLYSVAAVTRTPVSPPTDNLALAHLPLLAQLMWANLMLLLFNLVPAFPMDGGRVLRALLATRIGIVRATRVAAGIGQALAVVLGIMGLFGNVFLVLIAVFVFAGAAGEAQAVEARAAGRGITVEQMMVTRFESIPVHARLQRAVDLLLQGEQREFPVVDNSGRVEGLLTRENLIKGLSQRGPDSTVAEAMTPGVPAVDPTTPFEAALEQLRATGLPALPVVSPAGGLVGLLTMDNISDLLLVRRASGAR
jgi:Zn-dependent protease/predicted transcriptional regulator